MWAAGRGKVKSQNAKRKSQSRQILRFALCVLTFDLLLVPADFRAQQKPSTPVSKSPQQAFILRSTTNEVLVDVRVYDKSGKPVTDLKQSDFRVTEDGVQQTIRDFSLEDVEKLAQATGGNEKSQVIDLAKLPPEVNAEQVLQDHRLLVFFFDLSSMQPDELMRALKASGDFVTNRMTPADLVAVVTYSSSLRVTQDFTNDRPLPQEGSARDPGGGGILLPGRTGDDRGSRRDGRQRHGNRHAGRLRRFHAG